MLLGGMKVVGIYVWASDSAFKNSTIMLSQVVFFINWIELVFRCFQ